MIDMEQIKFKIKQQKQTWKSSQNKAERKKEKRYKPVKHKRR